MKDFGNILGQLVCGPKWQSSFDTSMHLKNMVILSLLNHEFCCISLVNYNNQFGIITCSKRVMIASNVMTHPQLSYLPIYALDWEYFYFGFMNLKFDFHK